MIKTRLPEIVGKITDIEKSFIKNDIEKAWKKHPIGSVITRKDGQKYKKVSETGNSAKDWQLVTKDKTKQNGSDTDGKSGGNGENQKSLKDHAKETSETNLQAAVKESSDPKVREAAHEELARREKEEKPKEENKSDQPGADSEKKSSEKEAASASKEGKVNDDYRKGFKSYSDKNDEERYQFYKKDKERSEKYLDIDFMAEKAMDMYTEEGYEHIRKFLSTGEVKEEKLSLRQGYYFDVNKNTIKSTVDSISKFIQNNKIAENLSLNRRVRGEGANFFRSLKKGDTYEDVSFSSCSLKEMPHFGDFNVEILAKKGSNVANANNSGELEYLIDKGSKFRVLDTSDKGIIVELL